MSSLSYRFFVPGFVPLTVGDTIYNFRQERLCSCERWFDNEINEPDLTLFNVGGASVHEHAHVHTRLFFHVSLIVKFNE